MTPPLELRPLREENEASFMAAIEEFQNESPAWDFALDFDGAMSFPEYVRQHDRWSRGKELPAGYVPASFFVGVVDGTVVGRVSLRHRLNEYLTKIGGHIGYGVVPSQRRRGYASAMLRLALDRCRDLDIAQALVTCDVSNAGSRIVIERCGGVLENLTDDPVLPAQQRRYWIAVS